jgi:hypothetical protein
MANYAQFNGGPLDEQLHEVPDEAGWPLPGELALALLSPGTTFAIGLYVKTNESQLSDEAADHPNLARGAEYAWRAGDYVQTTVATSGEEGQAWHESTGEGVDLSYSASKRREPFDSRLDYPERHTTRGVIG